MKNYNIFIISDDKKYSDIIEKKFLLSRKFDNISITNFQSALKILKNQNPDIIVIYISNDSQINFIKQLRDDTHFKNSFILMISENIDNDLLCKGFDTGIDDFLDINTDETLFSMHIIWDLKNKIQRELSDNKSDVLAITGIVDKNTEFYKKEYSHWIFEREYKKSLTNYKNNVFMMLIPDLQCRATLSSEDIALLIKKSLRLNDTGCFTQDGKIYLLLSQTDEKGAKNIFEKINNALPFDCSISASALNVSSVEKFVNAEKILNSLLEQALQEGNSYIFYNPKQKISISDKKLKNNIIIKKEYIQKIEKILMPAFFKMQTIYEPKLYNTEIKQIYKEKEYSFLIKNRENLCLITVECKNSNEINIKIEETFKQKNTCDNINMNLEDFTSEAIENIIQRSAEKFRKILYKKEI
ncbi:hypothetical protein IJG14_04190 [bacterium]|nr:hypothetical protein [bacterium]